MLVIQIALTLLDHYLLELFKVTFTPSFGLCHPEEPSDLGASLHTPINRTCMIIAAVLYLLSSFLAELHLVSSFDVSTSHPEGMNEKTK